MDLILTTCDKTNKISWITSQYHKIIEQGTYDITEKNIDIFFSTLKNCLIIFTHKDCMKLLIQKANEYNKNDLLDYFKDTKKYKIKFIPTKLNLIASFKYYKENFNYDKDCIISKNKIYKLTQEQKDVVHSSLIDSMMVVACAGSGKTTVILSRIKHLLDNGINDDEIILTTFTVNATEDMKKKLTNIIGHETNVKIGTIDSLSKYFLAQYSTYDVEKLDVEHLSYLFLKLIERHSSIIQKFKYLFVDEFQDINKVQFQIIKLFYENGVTIFCVGDHIQNIYSFRGSNIKYMLNFKKNFEKAKIYYLTINFRSSTDIIKLANACMINFDYSINKIMRSPDNRETKKPSLKHIKTEEELIYFIKHRIEYYRHHYLTFAVLAPLNRHLTNIKKAFENHSNINLDITTIHKSKGLEYDVVFLIGLNENDIPINKNKIKEGRRIFYVGITRTKSILYLCYNEEPSRYISEVII